MGKKNSVVIARLRERDGNQCHYCGKELTPARPGYDPDGASVDHVIPKAQGGTDAMDNLVLACRACNGKKGIRDVGEFRMRAETDAFYHWLMEGEA